MENIKEISKQLQDLIEREEGLLALSETLITYLCFAVLDKECSDEEFELIDLSDIDYSVISVGGGRNDIKIYSRKNGRHERVKSWKDMPKKKSVKHHNTFKINR
jgi:hypothetical protein